MSVEASGEGGEGESVMRWVSRLVCGVREVSISYMKVESVVISMIDKREGIM